MNPAKITIIVLDRNASDLATLAAALKEAGYHVLTASTEVQVERFARQEPVNLVVKGFEAGRVDAIALMRKVRAISRDTEFVLCGRGGTIAAAVAAVHQGACDYLVKPVNFDVLFAKMNEILPQG